VKEEGKKRVNKRREKLKRKTRVRKGTIGR
jgi:hypothetical protein